ncbi:MBL fold metallo-hydrolase RNA specificity domain-containing protein [Anaerotruncus rubiinfantis]|uniref:MBL fold metallo-hydrolase RNA specificity domain-containing protein n=1 Tax=Anaerotruncus rubiinfantis TaxID=1720200 RepID=UPI0034A3B2BB
MKLSFLGATHEVTGSCHYLQACGKKILIDCGMQQGPDEYEHQELPVAPGEIDFVLLTHAHIDHSGRLPLLAKYGFRGPVVTTSATADLCGIMLRDSAHIQEFEAEWKNRKGKRAGREPVEPMYTMQDAEQIISQLQEHEYNEMAELCEGVRIRFIDVGHLLGSASIEVWVTEDGITKKIVFSGDIGNLNQPLIRDPQYIDEADYVVIESTYGTRNHNVPPDYTALLASVIQKTLDRGGNVVIPSFAVGRTQELLYFLREIRARDLVKGHKNFPVYVDSPLAIEATNIFNENRYGYFDEEAMELVQHGINPITFHGLELAVTSDESRAINFDNRPKVIISASGMCEAGRIKHHLKHNLWRPECTIVFVGYQAVGTTGRALIEGAKSVKLFGETIDVEAEITQLEGISGHADQNGLLRWLDAYQKKPEHIFVVHGEDATCTAFAELVAERYGIPATAPDYQASFDLATNTMLEPGIKREPKKVTVKPVSSVFTRLVAAGQRLMQVIEQNKGGANKDLARFADQINALCEKWKR